MHCFLHYPSDHFLISQIRKVQAVTGACLMIRRDIFEAVGGFCADFINELEDLFLCSKVQQLGYIVLYNGKVSIFHHCGKSPGRVNFVRYFRNLEVFVELSEGFKVDIEDFITCSNCY
jgi:GT2 family glycosyltransferase